MPAGFTKTQFQTKIGISYVNAFNSLSSSVVVQEAVNAGDTLLVFMQSATSPIPSDGINTYVPLNTTPNLQVWGCLSTKASPNPLSVIINTSGASANTGYWHGRNVSSFGTNSQVNGSGGTPNAGNIIASAGSTIVVGVVVSGVGNLPAGSGYTLRINILANSMGIQDQINIGTYGSMATAFGGTVSSTWEAAAVVLVP